MDMFHLVTNQYLDNILVYSLFYIIHYITNRLDSDKRNAHPVQERNHNHE